MFGVFPLFPAYGREYKTASEVKTDWRAGKDFQTCTGKYCSIRDFPDQSVTIRYAQMRKCTVIKPNNR